MQQVKKPKEIKKTHQDIVTHAFTQKMERSLRTVTLTNANFLYLYVVSSAVCVVLQWVCSEPSLDKADKNEPVLIINDDTSISDGAMNGNTYTIYLPVISVAFVNFHLSDVV